MDKPTCSAANCTNFAHNSATKGLCQRHYAEKRCGNVPCAGLNGDGCQYGALACIKSTLLCFTCHYYQRRDEPDLIPDAIATKAIGGETSHDAATEYVQGLGYANRYEYDQAWAQEKGFDDLTHYRKHMEWLKTGFGEPVPGPDPAKAVPMPHRPEGWTPPPYEPNPRTRAHTNPPASRQALRKGWLTRLWTWLRGASSPSHQTE